MKELNVLITESSPSANTGGGGSGYELLDSGEGYKLERFGEFILSRPDPQALWPLHLDKGEWNSKADAIFTHEGEKSKWTFKKKIPDRWQIDFAGLKFWIKPTPFKHVGLFPEQAPNWEWMEERIRDTGQVISDKGINILNLFAYTGGATLACAKAGAKVTHIDSSKAAVTWAKENTEISGLADKPVRWIVEDARLFVEREIRRGNKYDGIIMDPPAFGHGPDSELWKIEEDFLKLIENCKKLLADKPLFFLINGYSAGYSALAYGNNLLELSEKHGGQVEIGELAIRESKSERLLPAGIFARWSAK